MKIFADIDKVIQANLAQLGALPVRPGYKIPNDWTAREPAIVVTVRGKKDKAIIPYKAAKGCLEKLQAAGLDMSKVRIQIGVNKGLRDRLEKRGLSGTKSGRQRACCATGMLRSIFLTPGPSSTSRRSSSTTGRLWPGKN